MSTHQMKAKGVTSRKTEAISLKKKKRSKIKRKTQGPHGKRIGGRLEGDGGGAQGACVKVPKPQKAGTRPKG